jgi:hypothetical protein
MGLKDLFQVIGEGVSFFSVVSCPGSLWRPKWWRRFGDLFDFLGYLLQRTVGGACWSEALQESLYDVVFLSVEELFKLLFCCVE